MATISPALQILNLPPQLAARFADATSDELAALEAWAQARDADPLEDEADDGPLSDPEIQAGYTKWYRDGLRMHNLHEAQALADRFGESLAVGIACSAWAWRLNGGGGGGRWFNRTAPDFAADLGLSLKQFRVVQTLMTDARIVRRKTGRNNVTQYWLDADALTALTYAHGEAAGVDFKGLAGRFGKNVQTVEQSDEMFHGLAESANRFGSFGQTGIQEKTNIKPTPAPAFDASHQTTREPGEDDEPETSKPVAEPEKPVVDHEAASDVLLAAAASMNLEHDPTAIRAFCRIRNVTPDEAEHAVGVARSSPNTIESVNYFKTVIESTRKEGRKRNKDTPTGGHADEALTRRVLVDLDYAAQHPPTPQAQADAVAAMRAALRLHAKALTR